MSDGETIILAVEKYPCLWNIEDKDYHNKDIKDLAWEQVCKEVINNWDVCTKADKENKSADVKKKWTHIRDYFRRDYQKNKNCPTIISAKKARKYVYAHLLYFLKPVFDKRHSDGNNQTNDSENTLQEQESEIQEEQTVTQIDDHTNIMERPSLVQTPLLRSSNRNKKDIPTQILNILRQNQQKGNQKRQDVEDDDTKFLLSLRTHMKHMNMNQKLDFKLGVLQLVKKINAEYYSPSLPNDDTYSDNSTLNQDHVPHSSCTPVLESSPLILHKTLSSSANFGSCSLQKSGTKYQSAPNNCRVVINSIKHSPPVQDAFYLKKEHLDINDDALQLQHNDGNSMVIVTNIKSEEQGDRALDSQVVREMDIEWNAINSNAKIVEADRNDDFELVVKEDLLDIKEDTLQFQHNESNQIIDDKHQV